MEDEKFKRFLEDMKLQKSYAALSGMMAAYLENMMTEDQKKQFTNTLIKKWEDLNK